MIYFVSRTFVLALFNFQDSALLETAYLFYHIEPHLSSTFLNFFKFAFCALPIAATVLPSGNDDIIHTNLQNVKGFHQKNGKPPNDREFSSY